jgi:hypothetical protein
MSPGVPRIYFETCWLTFCSTVAATPVVHAAPVHDFYPSATPGALPREYVDIPDHVNLNTPLSCHNAVVTFGDWLENGGFDLPRVTPIRLIMAAFMFGCAQMLFLIFFGDFALLTRVLNSLTRGLWMVSILLSLTFSLGIFTNYDIAGFEGPLDSDRRPPPLLDL